MRHPYFMKRGVNVDKFLRDPCSSLAGTRRSRTCLYYAAKCIVDREVEFVFTASSLKAFRNMKIFEFENGSAFGAVPRQGNAVHMPRENAFQVRFAEVVYG